MIELPAAQGNYRSSVLPINSQRCVNGYPVITRTEAFERQSVLGTPGLTELTDVVSGSCRGGIEMDGKPYYVVGGSLYRINLVVVNSVATFTATNLGSISGSARVSMAQNGTQLMIISSGTGYIYNRSTATLAQISDSDFSASGTPEHVLFIDSYFVVTLKDSKNFIVSATNDGTSWNALDVGSAESDPDDIAVPAELGGRLFIAGSETLQPYQNIGGSDFPFQAIPSSTLDKGCYAPFSMIKTNSRLIFVGGGENEGPAIWAFDGAGFEKLSHEGIDFLLSEMGEAELNAITSWTYADRGAYFVGLSLNDTTVVYDFASGRWHERRTRVYDSEGYSVETRWRATDVVRAYNRTLVGDNGTGKIGEADLDVFDEYGDEILRYVVTQPFENQGDSFRIPKIEITTESGNANSTEDDPQIRLSLSKNGIDFGPERSRSIGKVGERNKQQIWKKNGRFNRRAALRIAQSDKTKFAVVKLEAVFA